MALLECIFCLTQDTEWRISLEILAEAVLAWVTPVGLLLKKKTTSKLLRAADKQLLQKKENSKIWTKHSSTQTCTC